MFRDRVFMTTMGVSTLVHLSMVTLLSIYVWVPVHRPKYAQLEIKYLHNAAPMLTGVKMALQMPSLDTAPAGGALVNPPPARRQLSIPSPEQPELALPEISLPRLDTAQLEREELIAFGAGVRSTFKAKDRQDSWAQFIGGSGKLADRLRELTPLQSVFPEVAKLERPERVSLPSPKEGLAVYVEWLGEPRDRKLIFGSLIDSLWRIDIAAMGQPISVPFRVNARGEVIDTFASGGELLTSIGDALKHFRFASLDDPKRADQIGTLVIAPQNEQ